MRPSLLDPLFAPAETLPEIGPKSVKLFDRLLDRAQGARVVDVLFHLPHSTLDRRLRPKSRSGPRNDRDRRGQGRGASRAAEPAFARAVQGAGRGRHRRRRAGVLPRQSRMGALALACRRDPLDFWQAGAVGRPPPDRPSGPGAERRGIRRLPAVEPVYGLTEGLFQRTVARAADGALKRLPRLPEWIGEETLARLNLPGFAEALAAMHRPNAPDDVDPTGRSATRLAYDELFANQLALLLMRARMRTIAGRAHVAEGALGRRLEAALPFALTGAQARAVEEIRADLGPKADDPAPARRRRLGQDHRGAPRHGGCGRGRAAGGDDGADRSARAPAFRAAGAARPRGRPADRADDRPDRAAERRDTLAALASREIDIVVGTHALFQENVVFADLGLAVVDEQHRFGVRQRLALASKGEAADLLVMTATPIPRSLVLAYFGDMDVSALREKPPGREPIDTRAMPIERLDEIVAGLSRALAPGARAYWICPLVEESETLDAAAAEERAAALRAIFGDAVGLVHGRMAGADKDAAMERFQRGDTKILVATTVVEVGVDVPEATIMIVEHAERFGLAQLHQLRGRVGRGAGRSSCLLL